MLWWPCVLLPRPIPGTVGWHQPWLRPVWHSMRDRFNLLWNMSTVEHCRLQHGLAVVHTPGLINDSPSFRHVRWRDPELQGWLLGLPISRSNASGSFSLIGRWWQTFSDQGQRRCHEAESCVKYLMFILHWLCYYFHSGREFSSRTPRLDPVRPKALKFSTAAVLSRHERTLQVLFRLSWVYELHFCYRLHLIVFVSQSMDILLSHLFSWFTGKASSVQAVLGRRPNFPASALLLQVWGTPHS